MMRRHPEAGWCMLQRIPYLHEASRIVLEHQERFDGKATPRGCAAAGSAWGRGRSVADAFDDTSDSPTGGPPRPGCAAEFERCSGQQFDPEVVAVFCQVPPGGGWRSGEDNSTPPRATRSCGASPNPRVPAGAGGLSRRGRRCAPSLRCLRIRRTVAAPCPLLRRRHEPLVREFGEKPIRDGQVDLHARRSPRAFTPRDAPPHHLHDLPS
jgi:hypothetical protein